MAESNRSGLSRAEQIRQKRQQSSQERVSQVRQQVSQPAAAQTRAKTTVRRSSPYAIPNTYASRTAPVRKLHYAHGANGVEVRMPAMPTLQFNWQTASAILTFCLLVLVLLLINLDTFRVSAVQLKGSQRVSTADVQTVVVSMNRSIFTLDSQKSIAAVQSAFPEFSDIQLSVNLPGTVVLTVKERQPIIAWIANDQTQWIAKDGVVIPARGDGGTLPTIQSSVAVPAGSAAADKTDTSSTDSTAATDTTAVQSSENKTAAAPAALQYVDPQVFQAAISLSAQLPSGATLIYDPVSGMGWSDPQGWKVFFGLDLSNIALKEAEYQAICTRLSALGIKPNLISVAHVDAPYYRTE